jgi:CHAT domain-containing protein
LSAAALWVAPFAHATCDPLLANRPALYQATLEVRGHNAVSTPVLSLPTRAGILVLAKEDGLDVTLEVTADGKAIGQADNPIPRAGIQHLVFQTRPGAQYAIRVAGKVNEIATGNVLLRVLVDEPKDDPCLLIARAFGLADASFAAGQSVSLGTASGQAVEAGSVYRAAAAGYQSLAKRLEAEGPSVELGMAQLAGASVLIENTSQWAAGASWANRAARTFAAAGDLYAQARAQVVEASALIEIAVSPQDAAPTGAVASTAPQQLARARALLAEAAAFHARRGASFEQASAENYIGIAFYYEGRNSDAIRAYRRALALYEARGESTRQAQVLQNIAVAEYELGHFDVAIDRYSQVLRLIKPEDWPVATLITLNNSALANWASGNLDAALREYGRARAMARVSQQPIEEASSLQGIGSVYQSLGNGDLALDYYNQALPLLSASVDGRARSALLRSMANLMRERGRADLALDMDREALSLASSPATVARIRVQIANDLAALGKPNEALQEVDSVLNLHTAQSGSASGLAWLQRAKLRGAQGSLEDAETDLRKALKSFRTYEAPANEFAAWLELARVNHRMGQRVRALTAINSALALAEQVRLQSSSPELRATLMQPLRPAFELKIAMLAQSGTSGDDAIAALMTAEQSRARALADFRSLNEAAPGFPAERARQRRALYKDLAARRFQLERLLDRTGPDDNKVKLLRQDIAMVRQQLDQIESELGAASAGAVGNSSRSHDSMIDRESIPPDVAIVEYWLAADNALAWVTTREDVGLFKLGPTTRINAAALAFHESLRAFGSVPQTRRLQLGEQLGELILKPIRARLSGKRTLVFAPDGVLHYVPFAALRDVQPSGTRFLAERFDIAITDSVNSLLKTRRPRRMAMPPKQMLLVDDPVYGQDDPRVSPPRGAAAPSEQLTRRAGLAVVGDSETTETLPRLPGTAHEASAIAALIDKARLDRLEGFDATRERFLSMRLGDYRFIHIASHAVSDSEIPQLSAFILTTRDRQGRPLPGRVLAADLVNSQLTADVVVLSACETALGKNVAGEGLVGLRYVVLARGARAVFASLWQVPDAVTAPLMTAFYSALLQERATVVAASGLAVRSLINGAYKDPAFWAAFPLAIATLQL